MEQQLLIIRIGRYYLGLPSQNVRRALSVQSHIRVPLLKPNLLGVILYNNKFIIKLALDSALNLGLYKSFSEQMSDCTVILNVKGIGFCATVNDIKSLVTVVPAQIKPVAESPDVSSDIFPNPAFLTGFFEHEHKLVYILDLDKLYSACFSEVPGELKHP
ncbi:MAG: chemotaxis protein CheW [Chlorobiales bacterium]|nr:chemotaxis protein CheW [Chlorobiales bacterium]